MNTILELQRLDMEIAALKARETEIPKQKERYAIHRTRLATELEQSEARSKRLVLEQRECEREIEQRQAQVAKYEGQLYSIKKNEEYKALLHEIDLVKKQISLKEERIIGLMLEQDAAKEALVADRERIRKEREGIDAECAEIDQEYEKVKAESKALETSRPPMVHEAERDLLSRYDRLRKKVPMPVIVPLEGEVCGGCRMTVRPQIVNEIMANETYHSCHHCGRLLFYPANITRQEPVAVLEHGGD